ncbi:MAG: hypothetical protein JWN79_80 [Gemmatimonadetes bacterium]|jgi:hypothetical protein|nr:hypothetical protein [Gemmatimonadota bacterium]
MQHSSPKDTARTANVASSATTRAPALVARRAIDCGISADDRPLRARPERGDARHAYLTSRGTYAEQVQAV